MTTPAYCSKREKCAKISAVSDEFWQLPITLHADREHGRLRLLILLLLLPAVWLGYGVVRTAVSLLGDLAGFGGLLACLLGPALGLGGLALLEARLAQSWRSGRYLLLRPDGLTARLGATEEVEIGWQTGETAITHWYFRLEGYTLAGSERRAPHGWYCLAAQVQQGETRVVAYTFLSPQETAVYTQPPSPFRKLNPAPLYTRKWGATRPPLPPELLEGENGRYWQAEHQRWRSGLELTPKDFKLCLDYLAHYQPQAREA